MKIQIKQKVLGSVLFEGDFSCIADAIKAAIKSSADMRYADLSYADLRSADLSSADMRYADLSYADLRSADLRSASLRSASLRSADLRSADLSSADMRSADLSYADLSYADLSYADLRSADLRSANLRSIKQDFWAVLLHAIPEIPALRAALVAGKVNGTQYSGECACLVGTIANARHCSYTDLGALKADSERPSERWFLAITEGCTPENSQPCALAVEWLDEFTGLISAAKGVTL